MNLFAEEVPTVVPPTKTKRAPRKAKKPSAAAIITQQSPADIYFNTELTVLKALRAQQQQYKVVATDRNGVQKSQIYPNRAAAYAAFERIKAAGFRAQYRPVLR